MAQRRQQGQEQALQPGLQLLQLHRPHHAVHYGAAGLRTPHHASHWAWGLWGFGVQVCGLDVGMHILMCVWQLHASTVPDRPRLGWQ